MDDTPVTPIVALGKLVFSFPDEIVMSIVSSTENGMKHVTINFIPKSEDKVKK